MRDAIDGTAAASAAFKDYRGSTQGFLTPGGRAAPGPLIKIYFANRHERRRALIFFRGLNEGRMGDNLLAAGGGVPR